VQREAERKRTREQETTNKRRTREGYFSVGQGRKSGDLKGRFYSRLVRSRTADTKASAAAGLPN